MEENTLPWSVKTVKSKKLFKKQRVNKGCELVGVAGDVTPPRQPGLDPNYKARQQIDRRPA